MGIKILKLTLILCLILAGFNLISCSQVYVKVLPSVPTVMETVRVYGITPWTGEKDPAQLKLLEAACKADAQTVTATLARGMKFNYTFDTKANVTVENYMHETWAELHNFQVKNNDLVDAGQNKYILSTADVSLVYDIDEQNYNEMKKGIGVETRVSIKPDELLSINQIMSIAVKQAVKNLYGEKHDAVEGSVWVIKVLPEFNVSGTLSKTEVNRYMNKSGKYVPQSSRTMDFMVTLVIRKDFIPASAYNIGGMSSYNEVVGVIAPNAEGEFALPGFAFEEPENIETAKQKAKERAEKFADYISRGFEYNGTKFAPRADRQKAEISAYSFTTQAMVGGDMRQIVIGKGIVKPVPFEKPIVRPKVLQLKQVFQLENRELLEKVLDNLPDLLVVKAIKTYGSRDGMGYFGDKFSWHVYINEETNRLEFEISCEVYMHIRINKKND